MKDIGKLCGGCFEHSNSPELEKSTRKDQEVGCKHDLMFGKHKSRIRRKLSPSAPDGSGGKLAGIGGASHRLELTS